MASDYTCTDTHSRTNTHACDANRFETRIPFRWWIHNPRIRSPGALQSFAYLRLVPPLPKRIHGDWFFSGCGNVCNGGGRFQCSPTMRGRLGDTRRHSVAGSSHGVASVQRPHPHPLAGLVTSCVMHARANESRKRALDICICNVILLFLCTASPLGLHAIYGGGRGLCRSPPSYIRCVYICLTYRSAHKCARTFRNRETM